MTKVIEKIGAIERLGAPPISVVVPGEEHPDQSQSVIEQHFEMIIDTNEENIPTPPPLGGSTPSKVFTGIPEVSYKNTLKRNTPDTRIKDDTPMDVSVG
ncbi:hypothetical protein M5689_002909 [Euphorbia peplus]|nr:hypothetical protein M5689_002909 [Euphorbia peplus]